VREHAREFGLPVAAKAESMEICFIPRGETAAYLERRLPVATGAVVDSGGRELGTHRGAQLYTVGQRGGFGSLREAGPWYVREIDARANRLVVGRKKELQTRNVVLRNLTFVAPPPPGPVRCHARLRYHATPVAATLDGDRLALDEPFFGAAPGQSAVLYDGTRVIGGGIIADPARRD
jgi:tRNA-specific 2-thiouridylase